MSTREPTHRAPDEGHVIETAQDHYLRHGGEPPRRPYSRTYDSPRPSPPPPRVPGSVDELEAAQFDRQMELGADPLKAMPDGYEPPNLQEQPRVVRNRAIRLWIGAGFSFACAGACLLDAPLAVRLGLALVATALWLPAARASMSLAVIVAALAVPGCAFPTTFTYGFTKPGVTAERFRADLDAARLDAVESERTISEQTTRVLVLMKAKGYARTPNGEDPGEFVYIAPLR